MKRGAERGRRTLSRSTWAAVEVWSLTAVAHTIAGGALPSLPWLAGVAVLVVAASALVLRASMSAWVVLPALGASQVGLHLALTWMPPATTPPASMSHVHEMGAHTSTVGLASAGLTWQMLAAHVASALLTAAVWGVRRRAVETLEVSGPPRPVVPPDDARPPRPPGAAAGRAASLARRQPSSRTAARSRRGLSLSSDGSGPRATLPDPRQPEGSITMSLRTLARWCAVPAAISLTVLGVAAPASAHVTITPSTTAAGAFAVLTVSVPHGCEGSPTTRVTISMPDEINAVTPTRNALWEVEKEMVELDPPVTDSHGNEITERVATVTYTTDNPLPDGYRDAFELSLQLPESEGTTLVFPTVQTCEEGESAWIEVPAAGQSEDDLELPAPAVTITAAEGDGHDEDSTATDASVESEDDDDRRLRRSSADSEDSDAVSLWALGAGLLGVALGGAALVMSRRRS